MADNILEFYITMKDLMSSGFVKMAKTAKESFASIESSSSKMKATAQSAFGNMTNYIKQAKDNNNYLKYSVDELKVKLKEVNQVRFGTVLKSEFRTASAEAKLLEKQIQRLSGGGNRGVGGFMHNIGGGLVRKLAVAASIGSVMAFAQSSVQAAMEYEASGKRLEVLTGSRTGGQALNSKLFNLKKNYGLDASTNASTMLGFGINSQFIEKDIKELAAVSMGNTVRFKELTLAYSQTMAAGKLIGKDYRQFINAGFNPLQTISEHWKEFGFTTKKTIGELQETIRKGGITASMISRAFEIATGHGGRFAGMMDKMADTTQGKLLRLQGNFESFKIGVGDALLPVASWLTDVALGALDLLNITTTMPEKLMAEKAEIDSLVHTITSLNEQDDLRKRLMGDLITKYPDLFGKIDIEKTKNSELLAILEKVNRSYGKRIRNASQDVKIDYLQKEKADLMEDYSKRQIVRQLRMQGDELSLQAAHKVQPFGDNIRNIFGSKKENDANNLFFLNQDSIRLSLLNKQLELELGVKQSNETNDLIQEALSWRKDANVLKDHLSDEKQRKNFLVHAKDLDVFDASKSWSLAARKHVYGDSLGNGGEAPQSSFLQELREAMYPKKKEGVDNVAGEGGETAKGIAKGGPRVINIYGVKFIEHLSMHHSTPGQSFEELEPKLQEMYLRILNSGSKMQN